MSPNLRFLVTTARLWLCKGYLTKKERLAWAKKHEQWTLDRWKFVHWSDESKFEIFGYNHCVFVRCVVGERMISACVVPTVKHGGGFVMVKRCFAGNTH